MAFLWFRNKCLLILSFTFLCILNKWITPCEWVFVIVLVDFVISRVEVRTCAPLSVTLEGQSFQLCVMHRCMIPCSTQMSIFVFPGIFAKTIDLSISNDTHCLLCEAETYWSSGEFKIAEVWEVIDPFWIFSQKISSHWTSKLGTCNLQGSYKGHICHSVTFGREPHSPFSHLTSSALYWRAYQLNDVPAFIPFLWDFF